VPSPEGEAIGKQPETAVEGVGQVGNVMRVAAFERTYGTAWRMETSKGKSQGRNQDEISLAGRAGSEDVERSRKPEDVT
jgi:hypothetical protein